LIDEVITVAYCGKVRKEETRNMLNFFNIEGKTLNYPDGKLTLFFHNIQYDINNVGEYGDIIFLPSNYEIHPDHKTISELEFPGCKIIEYSIGKLPDNLEGFTFTQFRFKEKMKLFKKLYPSQYESLKSTNFDFLECEYFRVRK